MTYMLHEYGGSLTVGLLGVLLLAACWFDIKAHRIPNKLVMAGMVAGLACNASFAVGAGLFDAANPGAIGFANSLLGLICGFAAFVPLYLLRGMGAGDVKLMAMVGAFVGPLPTLDAAIMTLVVGGVVASLVAAWHRTFRQAVENAWLMVAGIVAAALAATAPCVRRPARSAGQVPYALAIAGGTLAHAVLARAGHPLFA